MIPFDVPSVLGALPGFEDEALRAFGERVAAIVAERATQVALRDRVGKGKVHFTGVMSGGRTACGRGVTKRCVATPEFSGVTCATCLGNATMSTFMRLAIRCGRCGDEEVVTDPVAVKRIERLDLTWYDRRDAIEAITAVVPCPECNA